MNGVETFENHPSALFVNCVSVTHPEEIEDAITLIKSTLEVVPYYITGERSRNQFKYSVAVDCEFLEYPAEFDHNDHRSHHPVAGYALRRNGTVRHPREPSPTEVNEDRNLVTCMTVCVDKALVVNFHIMYMIEHIQDEQEVGQVFNHAHGLLQKEGRKLTPKY